MKIGLYDNAKALQVYLSLVDSLPDCLMPRDSQAKLEASENSAGAGQKQAISRFAARLQSPNRHDCAIRWPPADAKNDTTVVDSLRLERSAADSLKRHLFSQIACRSGAIYVLQLLLPIHRVNHLQSHGHCNAG
jgi:hypothetical protein